MSTNGPEWLIYVILIFFAIMTIQFLRGKWSFLIAGYNTASKAEKEQYDEKKLCRVIGGCMGVITCLIALMYFTDGRIPAGIMLVLIFSDLAVTLFLANTICKKKL